MKGLTITLFLLSLSVQNIFAIPGEIWFYIDDNNNTNFKVVARRISLTEPLFGYNFMEIGNSQFDEVTSDTDVLGNPLAHPWDVLRGFDYLRDPHVWPLIGEGKLEFFVYRNDILLFQFGIDLVHYPLPPQPLFADITFYFTATTNSLIAYTNGIYTEILNNSFVNCWELQGMERNISKYVNPVGLTNLVGGVVENNIKTTFNAATMGFPYGDVQLGVPYNPGTNVRLWRGVEYGLSTSHSTYTKNGIIYNFRNWIGYEAYTMSSTLRVLDGTDEFRSMYYPTIPLTVSNNLEGGSSSNDFEITWQTPPITQTWQYGIPFNAFSYPLFLDLYSATATNQFQALSTTWWFYKWNDGSTNRLKQNLQITSPTNLTAYYKGHLRSNDQNAISSGSQRKLIRTDNGIYHCVYESMGEVWYTHSLTTNFNGQWRPDICISNTIGNISKNPSIDFEGNKIKIVFETVLNDEAAIYLSTYIPDVNGNYIFSEAEEVLYYPLSYFGNAKPVIAYTNVIVFIAYRKNTTDGLYQKTKWNVASNWFWDTEGTIPNTTLYSSNPSIAGSGGVVYLAWQHSLGIRYILGHNQSQSWGYRDYSIVSTGSGYTNSYSPSISLAKNGYPVVSWIGYNYVADPGGGINKIEGEPPTSKVVVRRAIDNNWSSFFKAGYNAVTTNNNSTSSTLNEESIIAWSEGSSPNFLSKWVRRVNGSYTDAHSLSHNGKQNQVSNGTSIDNIEGTVFTITQLPYMLSLVTTDFNQQFSGGSGLNKAGELIELSYGREGVIYKNGVEFLFNIGDIIVGDSVIKFIEQPDTILYSSAEELNTVVKTVPFYLSASTEFYFTDFYYVLNDSLADTSLTAEDEVNFKVELINNQSGQVIGTFDNITYTKGYLDKYANVSYQVDCSNIASGNYFLRLVTSVEGEAEYHLGNVQNSGEELSKHNYQRINFSGTELPESYSLEQNYPNPFNPNTVISYQLPVNGFVTLKVYDILGSEVTTLVNEEKTAGRYEINYNALSLASGVYIYRLNVNDYTSVKKMVLLK